MATNPMTIEQGPIRPPSEAASLLIRLTRNCPWNRCLFCPVYKADKFSRRSLEEIKRDIEAVGIAVEKVQALAVKKGNGEALPSEIFARARDAGPLFFQAALWLYQGSGAVFLQDADSMILPADQLGAILELLYRKVPGITRVTTYARARSLLRKTDRELARLKEAGLSRIHVGLESGHDPTLALMQKGVTGAQQVEAGLKVRAAGISLSEYVILGLGGKEMWREHALATAAALNAINPDYIRVRTLAVHPASPLYDKCRAGEFTVLDDEGIVREEELLLQNLAGIDSTFVSDHILNLLEEVQGKLPQDLPQMRRVIEQYFALPAPERERFRLGRRSGIYRLLDDRLNPLLSGRVEQAYRHLSKTGLPVDDYISQVVLGYL